MAQPLTQAVVEQFVALMHGRFTNRDIWNELDIGSVEGRAHLRQIMRRMAAAGIVRDLPDGGYERVNGQCPEIDWQSADLNNTVDLRFPFEIEKYAKVYPKSIIVVAGSKNSGKTAFLYNFIVMNFDIHLIDLYNSETGPEQMKERFSAWPDIPSPAPWGTFERYDHFADVIKPDRISVIDYLDLNSEVYLVGTEIDAMFRKLTTGVVVVAIQKPPPIVTYVKGVKKVIDRDLGYGGGFSAKRSVLYVSLSDHKAKLVYVKTPKNKKLDPTNKQWTYNLGESGVIFEDVKPYTEPMTEEEWQRYGR